MPSDRTRRLATALLLLVVTLLPCSAAHAETSPGTPITVSRGEVVLVRQDGSAVQPMPSGTLVGPGDELRTYTRDGATIGFLSGIEIELGRDTILIVGLIDRQDRRVNVVLGQASGSSVSRIEKLTEPGSLYAVIVGGAIAVTSQGTLALRGPEVTPGGMAAAAVCFRCGPGDYLQDLQSLVGASLPANDARGSALHHPGMSFNPAGSGEVSDDLFLRAAGLDEAGAGGSVVRFADPGPMGGRVQQSPNAGLPLGWLTPSALAYTWSVDGYLSGGSQLLSASQFGQTPLGVHPAVVYPNNPALQFTPPPSFYPLTTVDSSWPPQNYGASLTTDISGVAADGIKVTEEKYVTDLSPGTDPAGGKTTKERSGIKHEKDDKKPVPGNPPAVVTALPSNTTVTVECIGGGPVFNCAATVTYLKTPALIPTGDVQFSSSDGAAIFNPASGLCTLAGGFGNEAFCGPVQYAPGGPGTTLRVEYLPNNFLFDPSSGSRVIP
jgi:hypothetical protein